MKIRNVLSRPLGLLFGTSKKDSSCAAQKPQEVIVIQNKATKAAMIRDWVMACFVALFAGVTVHDKFLKPNQADNLDAIVRDLDLNRDGHISKEELETVKKLIDILEKNKSKENED